MNTPASRIGAGVLGSRCRVIALSHALDGQYISFRRSILLFRQPNIARVSIAACRRGRRRMFRVRKTNRVMWGQGKDGTHSARADKSRGDVKRDKANNKRPADYEGARCGQDTQSLVAGFIRYCVGRWWTVRGFFSRMKNRNFVLSRPDTRWDRKWKYSGAHVVDILGK